MREPFEPIVKTSPLNGRIPTSGVGAVKVVDALAAGACTTTAMPAREIAIRMVSARQERRRSLELNGAME